MSIPNPTSANRAASSYGPGAAPRPLVLGTRGSPLALRQTEWVCEAYATAHGVRPSLQVVETRGDLDLHTPLPEIGGKGLFTAELETAMRSGAIDAAVHSLKDLPVEEVPGLVIAAVCRRADPRDVLVSRHGSIAELPAGARVGTSSRRRAAQLRALRPDLQIVPVRGNVATRLHAAESELDAVVLAAAGLDRLGIDSVIALRLEPTEMLPAPGQGAIAIQCRADDRAAIESLRVLDDHATRLAVTAERTFLHALGGGCSSAVAALAEPLGETGLLRMTGLVASQDGREVLRIEGSDTDPVALGRRLASRALARGAEQLLGA